MMKTFYRYFFLFVTMVSVIAFFACKPTITEKKEVTLKSAYDTLFHLGTAMSQEQILGNDTALKLLVVSQFNAVTAENDMKWEKIHPQPNVYDFTAADSLVAFAKSNNMFVVGHCLVWHQQTPEWVFKDNSGKLVSRDTLLKRMHDHISTVVGRYKGRVQGWDVVNEAIDEDGTIRKTIWQQIIGDDFVEKAFQFAYEADSTAEFYYNDYSLPNKAKREGVVRLIKNLQSKGIKVDAIGEQGHYTLDYPVIDSLEESIVKFSELGCKVMITELDITVIPFPQPEPGADISLAFQLTDKNNPYPVSLPDSMQVVLANRYSELFKLFIKHSDKISRVTLWGVNDSQSWRNYWPINGRTDYPLLFDRNNKPKAAYDSIISCTM